MEVGFVQKGALCHQVLGCTPGLSSWVHDPWCMISPQTLLMSFQKGWGISW